MTPLLELQFKAADYADRGLLARAAEKFDAAAIAAAALLNAPDCLIVANLRMKQAKALLGHLQSQQIGREEQALAYAQISMQLLPFGMEVLLRRRAAGTLAAGACRPVEVAYFDSVLRRRAQPVGPTGKQYVSVIYAPCVGYAVYLFAAILALNTLANPGPERLLRQPRAADDTRLVDTVRARVEFVEHAMALLRAPPAVLAGTSLMAEAEFVTAVRALLGSCGAAGQQLARTWREVEASGVLRGRRLEEGAALGELPMAELHARVAQRTAARGLRTCALETCGAREVEVGLFKKCAACSTVVYCSREHQAADWPAHRAACKAARKAAAPEAGSA